MPYAQNFAISTVATAPSPATSGTTVTVAAGQGTRFADPATYGSYPATIWASGSAPDPTTAEIVLVTAKSTDTLTITRAQEGTTARTVIVGDMIAATVTAKWFGSATGSNSTSLGASSSASSSYTTAVGMTAAASAASATAFGALSTASSGSSTAVGASATAGGTNAVAIGSSAMAEASSTVIGASAMTSANLASSATVIGCYAGYAPNGATANKTTSGTNHTLVGYQTGLSSSTQVSGITCVGANAIAGGANAVSIGNGASATAAGAIALGCDSTGTAATSTTTDLAVIGTNLTTLQAGKLSLSNSSTTTTAPSAGGAGALPATPTGYLTVTIGGTSRQLAYY